ncbi:MAG TPA: MBL fold metallo-hydrolase [Gemmatimonadales bacterium]|nr:MBL fold metallo-hydrolase [Gemmatimonadales bacterium]
MSPSGTRKPHHRPGGGFRNPWPNAAPAGLRGLLKWRFVDRLIHPIPRNGMPVGRPPVPSAFVSPRAPADTLVLTWIGHATFLIQIGGLNLITDPMFGSRASPLPFAGPRRHVPPAIDLDALPPLDGVLLSHNHYDHLDDHSVRRLAARHPAAAWFAPLGVAAFLARRGARQVRELDWWEETRLGSLALACTPAQHFSARSMQDRDETLWCGWSVAAAARQLFFAGDTGHHPEFAAIGERFGPFHAALLPIGAYEPRWFMRPVHMNPEDAVQAYRELHQSRPPIGGRPAVMVGMHWGTFRLTDEPLDEPPARARAAWEAAGLHPERLWLLGHGESRTL